MTCGNKATLWRLCLALLGSKRNVLFREKRFNLAKESFVLRKKVGFAKESFVS